MPDALVSGYEALAGTPTLPDEDDRHVLAAAIRSGAQVIVTSNLKDFPVALLAPYDSHSAARQVQVVDTHAAPLAARARHALLSSPMDRAAP